SGGVGLVPEIHVPVGELLGIGHGRLLCRWAVHFVRRTVAQREAASQWIRQPAKARAPRSGHLSPFVQRRIDCARATSKQKLPEMRTPLTNRRRSTSWPHTRRTTRPHEP